MAVVVDCQDVPFQYRFALVSLTVRLTDEMVAPPDGVAVPEILPDPLTVPVAGEVMATVGEVVE